MRKFNEEMIKREGLPVDVFRLIHDLCYHHAGRDVASYVKRARQILKCPHGLCPACNHFMDARGKCRYCRANEPCCQCPNWAERESGCGCICHQLR
jgi:hypothetical protein